MNCSFPYLHLFIKARFVEHMSKAVLSLYLSHGSLQLLQSYPELLSWFWGKNATLAVDLSGHTNRLHAALWDVLSLECWFINQPCFKIISNLIPDASVCPLVFMWLFPVVTSEYNWLLQTTFRGIGVSLHTNICPTFQKFNLWNVSTTA